MAAATGEKPCLVDISYKGFQLDYPWGVKQTLEGYMPVYLSSHGHVVRIDDRKKTMLCDLTIAKNNLDNCTYLKQGKIALPVDVPAEPALFSIPKEALEVFQKLQGDSCVTTMQKKTDGTENKENR